MNDRKSLADQDQELARQIAGLLAKGRQDKAEALTPLAEKVAQQAFWVKMRTVLAVNKASAGLDILDYIADALLDGKEEDARDTLKAPIPILPFPSRQRERTEPPDHPRFTEVQNKRSSSSATSSPESKPHASKKVKSATSAQSAASPQPVSLIPFPLSIRAPADLKVDLEKLYRRAKSLNISAYERASPWVGQMLWYNPTTYPNLHVAHWRFWHAFRPAFFDWALYAPLNTQSAQVQRRKQKLAAVRGRLRFLSFCIETWGYYNFLQRLESNGNRNLLWWGGAPGKTSKDAKAFKGVPSRDLGELWRSDKAAYLLKMKNALKPFRIDDGGFKNLPTFLEQTHAWDLTLPMYEKRLSDRALARIRRGATSSRSAQRHWVGDITQGDWGKLIQDPHIAGVQADVDQTLQDGTYTVPVVPDFDPKKTKTPGYSPFKDKDGAFTALPPPNDDSDEDQDNDSDNRGAESDASEDSQESPSGKRARSSSDESEAEIVPPPKKRSSKGPPKVSGDSP